MKIYAKHLPYEDGHLGEVVQEMRERGMPWLFVIPVRDGYLALEGSHRLAAAHYLGCGVGIHVLQPDVEDSPIDWERLLPTLPSYEF